MRSAICSPVYNRLLWSTTKCSTKISPVKFAPNERCKSRPNAIAPISLCAAALVFAMRTLWSCLNCDFARTFGLEPIAVKCVFKVKQSRVVLNCACLKRQSPSPINVLRTTVTRAPHSVPVCHQLSPLYLEFSASPGDLCAMQVSHASPSVT